ncbi:MAG: phosphoribosylglycinamide formyltransferase [Tissierellia bacterium]|nr:phosphoribosylglycinamide formyltransferase [Tissierellia bacterium]
MEPTRIGVLISGGGTNLQAIIDNIKNGNINGRIELIISNKKDAYGLIRGKKANIDTLYLDRKQFNSEEEYNLELIKKFKEKNVDLVVLAGYLRVLSKDFIEAFRGRIINIHPSLIPSFCGKGFYGEKVHKAVLDYGVKITGATVHFVDEGTDTGPIILQEAVEVEDTDTLETLKEKVLRVEHKILVQAVKLYCQNRLSIEGRKVIIK